MWLLKVWGEVSLFILLFHHQSLSSYLLRNSLGGGVRGSGSGLRVSESGIRVCGNLLRGGLGLGFGVRGLGLAGELLRKKILTAVSGRGW